MPENEGKSQSEIAQAEQLKKDVQFAFKQMAELALDPGLGVTISAKKDNKGNLITHRILDKSTFPLNDVLIETSQQGVNITVNWIDLRNLPEFVGGRSRNSIVYSDDYIGQYNYPPGGRFLGRERHKFTVISADSSRAASIGKYLNLPDVRWLGAEGIPTLTVSAEYDLSGDEKKIEFLLQSENKAYRASFLNRYCGPWPVEEDDRKAFDKMRRAGILIDPRHSFTRSGGFTKVNFEIQGSIRKKPIEIILPNKFNFRRELGRISLGQLMKPFDTTDSKPGLDALGTLHLFTGKP